MLKAMDEATVPEHLKAEIQSRVFASLIEGESYSFVGNPEKVDGWSRQADGRWLRRVPNNSIPITDPAYVDAIVEIFSDDYTSQWLDERRNIRLQKKETAKFDVSPEPSEIDTGRCFAAGTMIRMADGSEKPIEEIRIGDQVMSFDVPNGELGASTVMQTFETSDQLVIDFHGTNVTPGHVYACADGQFRMLIDILEQDGAIVIADGRHIRARTGYEVGTDEDAIVMVGLGQDDGGMTFVPMRAGTVVVEDNGGPVTMLDYMDAIGWRLDREGQGFKVRDFITRDTLGFAWRAAAFPFDPRLVAGQFSEYRQGRIRVAKGMPVFPEDREFNGVIPQEFLRAH